MAHGEQAVLRVDVQGPGPNVLATEAEIRNRGPFGQQVPHWRGTTSLWQRAWQTGIGGLLDVDWNLFR